MSSAVAENKFMKVMPKTLANQLNLIKKDKEIDEQRQQKMQSEDCTLASDRILQSQFKRRNSSPKRNQRDSDDDGDDKWQKVPSKQKQIKKISLSSVKESAQKWQKNPEIVPVVAKPKKKITIQRDENGKTYFEEEIIQPATSSISISKSITHHHQPQHQHQHQHQQHHEQRIEQEYDSLEDSYEHKHSEDSAPKQQQSNTSSNNGGRRLSIKKNVSKYGYIQADNLPRQIDSDFFKDLLKKEKDNIVEIIRQDSFGKVKFNSKEAAERSVSILNKRTLFGSQIISYEISPEEFERQNTEEKSNLSNRIQSKNNRK